MLNVILNDLKIHFPLSYLRGLSVDSRRLKGRDMLIHLYTVFLFFILDHAFMNLNYTRQLPLCPHLCVQPATSHTHGYIITSC